MKKYLEAAKIVSVHGIRGEVNAESWCDSPAELCKLKKLYSKDGSRCYKVERARPKGENTAILKLEGTDTREDAELLRNTVLYCDRSDIKLPGGSYFIADLLGMECFSETGEALGKITDVFSTGANDVYEITKEGRKFYVPAVPSVILGTDVEAGKMEILKMEGLFDED